MKTVLKKLNKAVSVRYNTILYADATAKPMEMHVKQLAPV
jgi:hypothetical protein